MILSVSRKATVRAVVAYLFSPPLGGVNQQPVISHVQHRGAMVTLI